MMEEMGTFPLTFIHSQHLIKFVHQVIDNICSGAHVSHQQFQECPLDKFWLAVQCARKVIKDVSSEKLDKDEISTLLSPLGQEAAESFLNAVSVREDEIKKAVIRESLNEVVHLKDFDWNVRLAVSSDKILDLNESILTLHLHTSSNANEKATNSTSVEMTAEQVDKLLEQLKRAQEMVMEVSSNRKNV